MIEILKTPIFRKKNIWCLLHASFVLAFLIQCCGIIKHLIKPTRTNIFVEEKQIHELPILLKICVKPGFHIDSLQEEGYQSIPDYFNGQITDENKTRYGWGGKRNITVKELYNLLTHYYYHYD